MLIGELSKRSGFSRDTIRYYEKLKLLVVAPTRGGQSAYKNYTAAALARLRHVQRLKDVGFTLREIRSLLVAEGEAHACQGLPARLAGKILKIDAQIAALSGFKTSLLEMQALCTGGCDSADGMPSCVPASETTAILSDLEEGSGAVRPLRASTAIEIA